jgi:hypothetical protein
MEPGISRRFRLALQCSRSFPVVMLRPQHVKHAQMPLLGSGMEGGTNQPAEESRKIPISASRQRTEELN